MLRIHDTTRRALGAVALAAAVGGCTPEWWIHTRFDPVGQGDQAIAVATCESGLDPTAVSPGGGNHGLFQLNDVHRDRFVEVTGRPWSDVYDPGPNSLYARWLYDHSGWTPWTCQP